MIYPRMIINDAAVLTLNEFFRKEILRDKKELLFKKVSKYKEEDCDWINEEEVRVNSDCDSEKLVITKNKYKNISKNKNKNNQINIQ